MEPDHLLPQNPLLRRIENQSSYGTIRYFGPLKHIVDPTGQIWLGIEWDDLHRGKHNGTVENFEYFKTENNSNSGSLLKIEKANFGISILDAILMKYFKENPKSLKNELISQIQAKKTNGIPVGIFETKIDENSDKQKIVEPYKEKAQKTIETSEEKKEEKNAEISEEKTSQKTVEISSEKISQKTADISSEEISQKTAEIPEKPIKPPTSIEYDEDAYFETVRKHKKKVEFYGFDLIWKKLNNLKEIKELSLQDMQISHIGEPGLLSSLLPNLKNLALEKNLFFDYRQILHLGYELPTLESLSLSNNRLNDPEFPLETIKVVEIYYEKEQEKTENSMKIQEKTESSMKIQEKTENSMEIQEKTENSMKIQEKTEISMKIQEKTEISTKIQEKTEISMKIPLNPLLCFSNLKVLILIEMDLTWKILDKVLPCFQFLEELVLCRNKLNDFDSISFEVEKVLKNLKFLNLEENRIATFQGLRKFANLSFLEKLTLSKNFLQNLEEIQGFLALNTFSIEENLFEECEFLSELSQFPNLKYLRIKNNPVIVKHGASYIRQRAVAENSQLICINGSLLKKYERKDCEIFYLRKTFDDFFKFTNSQYYQYDLNDFLENFCKKHPKIKTLIKIFGNPYEMNPERNDHEEPIVQRNTMLMLNIVALAGPLLGKDYIKLKKKFPDSTTIVNLKSVLAKLTGISVEKMVIYYKAPNKGNEPMEILEEELKNLMFYSVCSGGDLVVDEKS